MSTDAIVLACTVVGVGIPLLGGIVHTVWIVSKMATKVDVLVLNENKNSKTIENHTNELNKHSNRITKLETKVAMED